MKNLIEFCDVRKVYNPKHEAFEVLKGVNFTIPKGSFTILYGPSGSGKSTILNTIIGLEEPTTGTVAVEDIDLYTLSGDERASFRSHFVGMVHQDNFWVNSLPVIDNVAMPLYLSGVTKRKARKIAAQRVKEVHLDSKLDTKPTLLSGGEQQRISVARATVKDPSLIIADEPTGNLDTKNGEDILNLLLKHNQVGGATVVMVTHNPDFVKYSNNLLTIRDGIVDQKNTFDQCIA